jgi:hypothetical protein
MTFNLSSAGDYAGSFDSMTREEQLLYLNAVSDKLRLLRKHVLNAQFTDNVLSISTRNGVTTVSTDLIGDADPGHTVQGQTETTNIMAQAFYNAIKTS